MFGQGKKFCLGKSGKGWEIFLQALVDQPGLNMIAC